MFEMFERQGWRPERRDASISSAGLGTVAALRRQQMGRKVDMSFGRELIQSAKEAVAIAKGELEPAGVFVPEAMDVATTFRTSTKLNLRSTGKLADKAAAVREWNRGIRAVRPIGAVVAGRDLDGTKAGCAILNEHLKELCPKCGSHEQAVASGSSLSPRRGPSWIGQWGRYGDLGCTKCGQEFRKLPWL